MKIRLDKLDILFSQFVRRRAILNADGCEYCGKPASWKELQCSHFHGRRKRSTRLDPENCCGLCFTCHLFLGDHPNIHTEFFKKRLGSERFELLNIRANQIVKVDKEKITASLKEKIKELEK